MRLKVLFLIFVSFKLTSQINTNLFKWQGNSSSSWSNSLNWQVWDIGSSSWVANSTATYPNASTHTVTVDFTSATTKTLTMDIATGNADVGEFFLINNSGSAAQLEFQYNKSLSVYNTFSVSGTSNNLIYIYCSTPVNNTYDAFGYYLEGGGALVFKPNTGNTINPIFASATTTNICVVVNGLGTTNVTENNLVFQSLLHRLGDFNLNGNTLNCKSSFRIDPVNVGVDVGNTNILGSVINTQNLVLSNSSLFNFSAQTTTVNINGNNTTAEYCFVQLKGSDLATTTATLAQLNIMGNKLVRFFSNYPSNCSKKVLFQNVSTSEDLLFFANDSPTEFHIKNWSLTKPLTIRANHYLVSFKDIESIITAPSTCAAAYNFMSEKNQVDVSTNIPVSVNDLNFFNVKLLSGSITTSNAVDIGYNSGIIFNSPLSSFGATTLTWNGSVNTYWNNPLNWTPNCAPSILTNVIVPAGTPNSINLNNCAGLCYNFTSTGSPTVIIREYPALNIGGSFIRSVGTVVTPLVQTFQYETSIFLLGVLPNTTYNITSNNTLLYGAEVIINANQAGANYELTDAFSVNYPCTNNANFFVLLSGKFKSNGFNIDAGRFHINENNIATCTRSLDISNSIVRLSPYNATGVPLLINCKGVQEFNTNNSSIYFNNNPYVPTNHNITTIYLPANNHLATPSFSLNRVIFEAHPTLPAIIYHSAPFTNTTSASGFKINSIKMLGDLEIKYLGTGYNLLNIDSLYVAGGHKAIGDINNSITINKYISSPTNCQTGVFTFNSSLPSPAAGNQFYINTGATITYSLSDWNIDAVRVNQSSGGIPSIVVNNANLSANSGISPANGWQATPKTPKTFYWIGEGATTNWTDLDNWSFAIPTNGDDITAGCVPSINDDVLFTNLSFYGNTGSTVNTSSVVTVNTSVFYKDMRWLGPFTTSISGSTALYPIITNTNSIDEMNCYGSIRMHNTMKWKFGTTINNANNVRFFSAVNDTIEMQNNSFNGDIYFLGSGKYEIWDSLVLCNVTASTFNSAISKGTIYHLSGEIDALGHNIFACAYNSHDNLSIPRKLNINNSKLYFIQVGVMGGGIRFGNAIPNTYTLNATNSIINIKPYDDYCYTCGGAYNTDLSMVTSNSASEPRLNFNVINVVSFSSANTGYYIYTNGNGVDIDSLTFDVLNTHFLNTVSTETNTINYLKYKVGSTNNLTSGATTILKELDARSICDPITIQSTIVGSYSNLCPMTSTALVANETALKFIHSACGAYVPTNYNKLNGSLCAFVPAGSENANAWSINPFAPSLGFISNRSATITCSQLPFVIPTTEFNVSATTHTLIWQSANGNYIGTPTGPDLTSFTTTASGVHTLTVTYKPGCLVTDTYTINLINDVTSVISTTNITCNGSANGAFSITATTASLTNSNYSYSFTPSTYTTNSATNVLANNYTYTVTNTINPLICKTTGTFVITDPLPITTTISLTNSVSCFGASTASVTSAANGGTGSYSFNWTNGINTYTTQHINNAGAGTYTLYVTDINNCLSTSTLQINEPSSALTITSFTNGIANCSGLNASASYSVLGGTPAYQFVFIGTNSTQSYTTNAYSTSSLSAGSNTLLVIDANSCETFTTFTVLSNTVSPNANFSVTNACINNTISINNMSSVTTGSITSYNWNFGLDALPVTSTTLQTPSNISYSVAGIKTLTLIVIASNGCNALTTQTLLIGGFATTSLVANNGCYAVANTFSCELIPNNSSISTYTYQFGDGNSSTLTSPSHIYQNASLNLSTVYNVSVTVLNNGCVSYATNTVLVYPLPVANFVNTNTCINTPPHFFDASTSNVTGSFTITNYSWNFGDGQTQNTPNPQTTHAYSSPLVYNVILSVTSNKGCMATITQSVSVYPKPMANYTIVPDLGTVIEPKFLFENQSTGYTKWLWNFGDNTPLDSINENVSHYYNSLTKNGYNTWLIVSNEHGCTDTASIFIELTPDFVFYIPNAFSPSEDGINELFTGVGIGITKYEMWIYDRWGEQIYYTDDIYKGWNGKKLGAIEPCKQDVYIWKVELKDVFNKKHSYVGHVTLLR